MARLGNYTPGNYRPLELHPPRNKEEENQVWGQGKGVINGGLINKYMTHTLSGWPEGKACL